MTKGFKVLNADTIGHKVYVKGSACYHKIIEIFGPNILDQQQSIDRKKLGSIVFADPSQLKMLTDIVWPQIGLQLEKDIQRIKKDQSVHTVFIEAAVLLEANWGHFVDEIWLVYCSSQHAIKRIIERDGLTPSEAEARIHSQLSNEEKMPHAHVIIQNDASQEEFMLKIEDIIDKISLKNLHQ